MVSNGKPMHQAERLARLPMRPARSACLLALTAATLALGEPGPVRAIDIVREPVVPSGTAVTIGVLNTRALGKNLEGRFVYRLPEVCAILGKEPGACVELRDYALLAASPKGIFQHAQGRRILLLTGGEKNKSFSMAAFMDCLHAEQAKIELCALAHRHEKTMRLEVLEVQEV